MKTARIFPLFALAMLSILCWRYPSALAQGTAFTYDGQLQNSEGPANGTYDFTFTLYPSTNTNAIAVVGPVTNNTVGVTNGLFTTLINFGHGAFTGDASWMEIGVATNGDTNFVTLTPRQEITPAPYAIFSETASNVSGSVSATQLTGVVNNAQLADASITLKTGPGLSGGGEILLGGSTTLSNTGVVSITGNSDFTATNVAGAVVLGDTATNSSTPKTIVKRDNSGNFSAGSITLSGKLKLPSTDDTAAIINSGSALLLYGDSNGNFFIGPNAGNMTTTGSNNTAIGVQDLVSNAGGLNNTAAGFNALYNNTEGNANTGIGASALFYNTIGTNNTAVGFGALEANTNGYDNTAIGYGALFKNVTGYGNSASGYDALYSNSNGSYNTAQGFNALNSNAGGSNNTATGYGALFKNTSASYNTATGMNALFSNTSGSTNTATGAGALQFNTSGIYNTATGGGALEFNISGLKNTGTGFDALEFNTTGSTNTATGAGALEFNTTGSYNTATGFNALFLNTNGANDTADGFDALEFNTSGSNNTANGYGALYANTSGSYNTANGYAALFQDTTGEENTANGVLSLLSLNSGNQNTAEGAASLQSLKSGDNNIGIGYLSGSSITKGNNNIDIGNNGNDGDNGIIRIGTQGTQTATYLAGTVYANGVQLSSDRDVKENFASVDTREVLAKVTALPVTQWNYKTESKDVQHIGPMAQDFQAAFKLSADDKHISVVDEGGVALAAIQGLNEKLNEKDVEIQDLKRKLDALQAIVNRLAANK